METTHTLIETFILNLPIFVYSPASFAPTLKLYAHREEGWELTIDQMLDIVKKYDGQPVTEVHIVGGVHPKMNLQFFTNAYKRNQKSSARITCKRLYSC